MHFRIFVALSIAVAVLTPSHVHAQSAGVAVMVPGLWEITVQTRAPIIGPPTTHTVCIDKEHVTKPETPKSRPNDDCQVTPNAAAANETAYTVHCTRRNVTSTSRFAYSSDHFEGTVVINTAAAEIHQAYAAKRISDCDDQVDQPATTTAH